jgi:16S rRNA (guanine527-N7)-methyltransferase
MRMHPANKTALLALAREHAFSPQQLSQLEAYTALLEAGRQKMSLFSSGDLSRLASRHIAESLEFCAIPELQRAASLVDMGSGAGFPGIPIKICFPQKKVILIEARKKKALFLAQAIAKLSMTDLDVIAERAEQVQDLRVPIIVARAVAPLRELYEWGRHLLLDDGAMLVQKGGDLEKEYMELHKKFPRVQARVVRQFAAEAERKIILLSAY